MKYPSSNILIETCKRYLAACYAVELTDEVRTLSLDPILETLPLIIKKPGLVYEIMTPATGIGMGGECIDYARPESEPPFSVNVKSSSIDVTVNASVYVPAGPVITTSYVPADSVAVLSLSSMITVFGTTSQT